MIEPVIAETDPRVILPVNPQAAIVEAFAGLERRVAELAEFYDYHTNRNAIGISQAQFLYNINVIPSGTLKIWQILKNVRDQAIHLKNGVDADSARKYLSLVEPEQKKLDGLLAKLRLSQAEYLPK